MAVEVRKSSAVPDTPSIAKVTLDTSVWKIQGTVEIFDKLVRSESGESLLVLKTVGNGPVPVLFIEGLKQLQDQLKERGKLLLIAIVPENVDISIYQDVKQISAGDHNEKITILQP